MKKTREAKIIEHGLNTIEELKSIYEKGVAVTEYEKLLKEYEKLYRRYGKTIKLSDTMGNAIMGQNDNLKDKLHYTIQTARNKLMENVSEHKKTKDTTNVYKEKLEEYKKELENSLTKNAKIQSKLDNYIKKYGEISHQFNEDISIVNKTPIDNSFLEINPIEFKNTTIQKLIALELKNNPAIVLMKIQLKNFDSMQDVINHNGSVANFLKGIYKFIKNSFSKESILFHENLDTFYLISKNEEINYLLKIASKLGQKRSVYHLDIDFFVGMAKSLENDSVEKLLQRCQNAFENSVYTKSVVVK